MMNSRRYLSIIVFLMTLLIAKTSIAETEHFEKGDLIYRKGFCPAGIEFGHAGIYWKWDSTGSSEERKNHWLIESVVIGVTQNNFNDFYNYKPYLGSGAFLFLTAEQREKIVKLARTRIGYEYNFGKGYKDRVINGEFFKTYRCEGLAEHCYELTIGGIGIVDDNHCWELTPLLQRDSMRPSIPIAPKFKGGITITPSEYKDSKYYVKDIVTIKAKNVSDSNWGSGVEKVEFWLGRPGMPLNEDIDELIGTDNERELIMRDYSYVWDTTTVTSGEYTTYLKAYDQAGNSRISFGIPVVVSNVEGPNIIYISPADGENISNFWWSHVKALIEPIDSLHPIDLDSIELRLDGNIITHFTNNTNGYHMVSIFSTEDIGAIATSLPKGPHTFSIKVSDITGETSYKEWTLFVYHAKHLRPTQALNIRAKDIVYPINPNTCSMWIPQYYDEFYLNNYRDYNTQEQRFCYYVYRNFVSFDASVIVDNISKATLLIEGFFNNAPFDIEIWTSDWDYDIRRSWDSNISFVGKFNKDDVYNDYYYYIQIDPSVVTKAGETKFMFIASPELLLNSYVYMNGSGYMAQLIIDDPNYFDK